MHISGWLLDHLIDHYPEGMTMLREMVINPSVGTARITRRKHFHVDDQ